MSSSGTSQSCGDFGVAPAHVQANAVAWHVTQRPIDGRDDLFDEGDEGGHRLVLVGDVAFEREIGRIDLQQQAVLDDPFVLDLERAA